jgi:LPS sulfotransferase NodH
MTGASAPFVILTFPRTGSAWLVDTLDSHPAVVAYDELFYGAGEAPAYARSDLPNFESYVEHIPKAARRLRLLHRIAYLRAVYRLRPGVRAAGFKLQYVQARVNPGILPFFARRRVRAIHLVRANLLDAVISYDVARKTGVFHPQRGDAVPDAVISLDPAGLRERLELMESDIVRARSWIERFRLPRIEVSYEELVGRRKDTLGRILRFLGVEPRVDGLDSSLVRTRPARGVERIENLPEVHAALTGTRFEWMLGGAPQ